jgi:ABC-type transport system involved in multi-copper enzyme maturation permease subunit
VEEKRLLISLCITWILIAFFIHRVGFPLSQSLVISLGFLLPILNIFTVVFLISSEFPIEREVRELRRELGRPHPNDAKGYLREGSRLSGAGRFDEAELVYNDVIKFFPNSSVSSKAEQALAEILQWRKDNSVIA